MEAPNCPGRDWEFLVVRGHAGEHKILTVWVVLLWLVLTYCLKGQQIRRLETTHGSVREGSDNGATQQPSNTELWYFHCLHLQITFITTGTDWAELLFSCSSNVICLFVCLFVCRWEVDALWELICKRCWWKTMVMMTIPNQYFSDCLSDVRLSVCRRLACCVCHDWPITQHPNQQRTNTCIYIWADTTD